MLEAAIALKCLPSGAPLLRDVAFAAGPGETVALLGASGSGKTTTLRILMGLDRRFQGTVQRSAVRLGVLFQEPRLLPWRTLADNIRLAVPSAVPAPDIGALLAAVALPASAGSLYPRQVSLGMARRAALARALAVDPDLLILDEPFASLDPGSAGVVAARLTHAARDGGAAVVAALHDVDRAVAWATRIVVLAGRPATVAHLVELAPGAPARAAVRTDLIRRFPFLSAPGETGAAALPDARAPA